MPYIGQGLSEGTRQLYTYTATANQSVFSASYTPGKVDVFQNGVLLFPNDYTATDGATITLSANASLNDEISIIAQDVFSVDGNVSNNYLNTTLSTKVDETHTGNVSITGYVGIGTSSPAEELDVYGSIGLAGKEIARRSGNDILLGDVNAAGGGGAVTIRTSGGDKLKIDTSGNVTKPSNPAFVVRHQNNTLTTGVIVWNLVHTNIGSRYNNTNGRFTAPVTGLYYLTAHTLVQNASTGEWRIAFYKNGSTNLGNQFIHRKTSSTWQTLHINAHVYMNANDYVTVNMTASAGAIYSDANYNQFSGHLVS